jgi:hypothetical protein
VVTLAVVVIVVVPVVTVAVVVLPLAIVSLVAVASRRRNKADFTTIAAINRKSSVAVPVQVPRVEHTLPRAGGVGLPAAPKTLLMARAPRDGRLTRGNRAT